MMKVKSDAVKQNSSWIVVSWRDELFRVLRVRNNTFTVSVNSMHNVVSIDRITLARAAKEALLVAEKESQVNVQNK